MRKDISETAELPVFRTWRKRPVVIEAHPWTGENWPDFLLFIVARGGMATTDGDLLVIHTLEGMMTADVGDWIIRGVAGEFYPCKPDIFAATYEPASPASSEGEGDA
jgi:hypothetical protein